MVISFAKRGGQPGPIAPYLFTGSAVLPRADNGPCSACLTPTPQFPQRPLAAGDGVAAIEKPSAGRACRATVFYSLGPYMLEESAPCIG